MNENLQSMMTKMMNNISQMGNKNTNSCPDPSNIEKRKKSYIISQNISASISGSYKNIRKYDPMCNSYESMSDNELGKIDHICEVKVIHEHALDIASTITDIGVKNFTKQNKLNPVILNVVGKDFLGRSYETSDEMRDETLNLRTTFCTSTTRNNVLPIKENHCLHTKNILVIRPKNVSLQPNVLLPISSIYRTDVITTCPITQEKNTKKMNSNDFIKTCTTIECVFQTALALSNYTLILTPFGYVTDNNPTSDIIKIYNYCIMKYGHKFKSIIIAIPSYYPKQIFDEYQNDIVKPNELCKIIDDKYETIFEEQQIKNKLKEKLKNNTKFNTQKQPSKKLSKEPSKEPSKGQSKEPSKEPSKGPSKEPSKINSDGTNDNDNDDDIKKLFEKLLKNPKMVREMKKQLNESS